MDEKDINNKLKVELKTLKLKQIHYEKQLKQNDITIPEYIPYTVAKEKTITITKQMNEYHTQLMSSTTPNNKKEMESKIYFLEQELLKYSTVYYNSKEYKKEQYSIQMKWEKDNESINIECLQKVLRCLPTNIKTISKTIKEINTPNGKTLSKQLVQRYQNRQTSIQLLRMTTTDIEKIHPATLCTLGTTGLTIIERRAIHYYLKDISLLWEEQKTTNDKSELKYQWYHGMEMKLKEMIKNPITNNKTINALYDEDYGYPNIVTKSKSISTFTTSSSNDENENNTDTDESISTAIRERLQITTTSNSTTTTTKLLNQIIIKEKHIQFLRQLLVENDVSNIIDEIISYDTAKEKVEHIMNTVKSIAMKLAMESDSSKQLQIQMEYTTLAKELQYYTNAMTLTEEWTMKQIEKEKEYELSISKENIKALQNILCHMPINISELNNSPKSTKLLLLTTPNKQKLSKDIIRSFQSNTILELLRYSQTYITNNIKSSVFETNYKYSSLTITERRALFEHLKDILTIWKQQYNSIIEKENENEDEETNSQNSIEQKKELERKMKWLETYKRKFKESLENYNQHIEEYGSPENHPFMDPKNPNGGGCPLDYQCPIKMDLTTDYNTKDGNGYGYPTTDGKDDCYYK